MHSLREVKSLSKFLSETLQDFGTMPIFKRTFSQDLDLLEQHLTKDILTQTDCNTTLTNLKTKFENAFNSEFKELQRNITLNMSNVKKSVAEITHHQREYERRMNKRHMQMQESKIDTSTEVDADLFVTKSSGKESEVQDDISMPGNDTYANDAAIRPIYDEEPMAKTTSLLANNADLKAQIQEKVFAIPALKNDLRKLKGNSVDTKFAKTSVLGKPVLQSLRSQLVVRQPNAFKSERPQMSKQWFASKVYVNNNLSRPVTQHYLPKKRESVFAKPDHMIATSLSRNSSKNMPRFSSNDMVYNHYLEEARRKTQERNRNSKSSVMHTASPQTNTKDSKPKPRSNNQTSRSLSVSKSRYVTITVVPKAETLFCSTCHKCVFNANHDACITKLLKEVNSRAKIQSHKTRNHNKPVDQKSHIQKHGKKISTGHRFSFNKTTIVYEKTPPRSDLR
nr:hypothetical protein [Tanacetum cinerariifolium]